MYIVCVWGLHSESLILLRIACAVYVRGSREDGESTVKAQGLNVFLDWWAPTITCLDNQTQPQW